MLAELTGNITSLEEALGELDYGDVDDLVNGLRDEFDNMDRSMALRCAATFIVAAVSEVANQLEQQTTTYEQAWEELLALIILRLRLIYGITRGEPTSDGNDDGSTNLAN